MFTKKSIHKILTLLTTSSLIILILFSGTPPINAVLLSPGEIDNDEIMTGTTVIFKNVTLTIRSNERIPIEFLKFTVYNSLTDKEIGYTTFEINGDKIQDAPLDAFTIIRKTQLSSDWYGYGYNYGYDEHFGYDYSFGFGYGYGYGNPTLDDISIVYDIIFKTHIPGTYYATIEANCTTHEFISESSADFIVISKYPPVPQKEIISPKTLSAVTDLVNFTYDFIDLEDDLDHITIQINGPFPYNTEENYIKWTFSVDQDNPWDEWVSDEILIAQDMGITPFYNSSREEWKISIDTNAIWNDQNPWNQSINSSVWPSGGYNFSIEVVDVKGNTWGSISDDLDFSTFFYSFHCIQPIIDNALSGDKIYILNGTFNDTILIDKKVHLIGSENSIIQPESIPQIGAYDVRLSTGSSGSIIENIIFDFNGENNNRSGTGLSIGQANRETRDIIIRDNIFYPGDRTGIGGYAIHTVTNGDISGLSIRDNLIIGNDNCNGNGVFINPFYGPYQIEIYRNDIIGNISNGIIIQSSQVYVSNNYFNNTGSFGITGISFVDSIGGMTYNQVYIITNRIYHFTQGIIIGNPTNTGSSLTAEISSNTISDNMVGILARFGANLQNSVHFNNIMNNSNYGINNIGTGLVNATYNWWGHPSGPYHPSNPSGLGNQVGSNVLFSNWLGMFWNNTVWVDDNYDSATPGWGIDHFNLTSQGINAVFDGGFVCLNPGVYTELLTIDKPLTLCAKYNFPNATVITDEYSKFSEFNSVEGQTIQIASKDVSIKGLKIKRVNNVSYNPVAAIGNKGYPDIYGISIDNCTIQSIYRGIYLTDAENVIINDNYNISGDQWSVYLESINTSMIDNNYLTHNNTGGIHAYRCNDIQIINNTIRHKVDYAILLNNCDHVVLSDGDLLNNSIGVSVIDSIETIIKDIVIQGCHDGINLFGSSIVTIDNISFNQNIWNITHAAHILDYYYYGSIQNAVLNAGVGNTIDIYHGVYEENILFDKEVLLQGYNEPQDVIIDGGLTGPAAFIGLNTDVHSVHLKGVTLTSSNKPSVQTGKYQDVQGLTIEQCIIENTGEDYAVYIDPNQFSDFPPLRNGTNPFFIPVKLIDNTIRGGVFYQYKPFEIYGVDINPQFVLQGNDIDTIRLNGSIAVVMDENTIWSLGVSDSYDITLRNNNIINTPGTMRNGVHLWSLENESPVKKVTLFNNSIIGYSDTDTNQGISGVGVLVAGAMDVSIDANTFLANSKGIYATEDYLNHEQKHCEGNISGLIINSNNMELGQTAIMLLENVSHVIIRDNNLSNNGQGIWLRKAYSNTIQQNTISDHYYGIKIDQNTSGNFIYDNAFINNNVHAQDQYSFNKWNITLTAGENVIGGSFIGGNYWDTYAGIDTDGDYIGDTLIPFTDQDNIRNGGDYAPLLVFDDTPPFVEVLYPNGGEVVNTSVVIEWFATDTQSDIANVSLYYSDDNGSSWYLIADNEDNDGFYTWDITDLTPGENYSIKIEVFDIAGNANNDTSNEVFGIDEPDFPGIHVEILRPLKGWVYFFNKQTMRLFPDHVFIIGDIYIKAEVESVITIDRVEFYIDEELVKTFSPTVNNLYEWNWDERSLFFHTLSVKAYDIFDHVETKELQVFIYNLDIIP